MRGCVCVRVAACDPISYSNFIFSSNHSYTLILKMMSTHYCLSKELYCFRSRDSLSLTVYPRSSCCPWFCHIPSGGCVLYFRLNIIRAELNRSWMFICVCKRMRMCVRDRESDTDTQEKGFFKNHQLTNATRRWLYSGLHRTIFGEETHDMQDSDPPSMFFLYIPEASVPLLHGPSPLSSYRTNM